MLISAKCKVIISVFAAGVIIAAPAARVGQIAQRYRIIWWIAASGPEITKARNSCICASLNLVAGPGAERDNRPAAPNAL